MTGRPGPGVTGVVGPSAAALTARAIMSSAGRAGRSIALSGPAPKVYVRGTHRTQAPAETLARLAPLLSSMGITRVANITGLDCVGIPVVMVCRPNSRSIAVSQGKGLELAAAKASGLMEAVETFHAEAIMAPLKLASVHELARSHPVIDVAALPRAPETRYRDDEPLLWIEGRDLLSGGPCWVPYELVHTNYTLPRGPAAGAFPANTNGLASGNHLLEAISHGLHEVIERDATSLWKHAPESRRRAHVLDLDTVDDDACRAVLGKFRRAGIGLTVWDTTTDVGIASFYCLAMGGGDDAADPEFGGGCHPAREVALLRALTEAAQARTTYIAGSRDDFSAQDYSPAGRARRVRECRRLIERHRPARPFQDVPTRETDDIGDDVSWAVQRLLGVGLRQVVVVDLTKPELGLPVARVIVPGLEGLDKGGRGYVPGRRARAMQGHRG